MMRLTIYLLSTMFFTGCYDSAPVPKSLFEPPAVTTTIAQLRQQYVGNTFAINSEAVIKGRVTSNDAAGNFYRTLTIEEDGAAVEVMAGIDALHTIYPEGSYLTITLKGLAVGESHGVIQIGRMPAAGSGYATDYIGSRPTLDQHLFRSGEYHKMQPLPTEITSLTPDMAGMLVRIDGVRFTPKTIDVCEWSGYKRFCDKQMNSIHTYTRQYANFAEHIIPDNELLIFGILQYDASADEDRRYTIKMRNEADCWF